jgi:hypothetical protein
VVVGEGPLRHLNIFKAGFMAIVGIYGLNCAANPGSYGFLDSVDLIFHEAGHVLFGIFGEFIGILGGTLMQLLIPASVTVYFAGHQRFYSAAVTLFWVAQSLFNVSVYLKDARARVLPLLGGEGVIHDWHYILGRLHLLAWDQVVGNLIYTVGVVLLGVSVVGGFYYSLEAGSLGESESY